MWETRNTIFQSLHSPVIIIHLFTCQISIMEVSSSARGCGSLRHCASEELLLKKAWFPHWSQVRFYPVARDLRPLVGQTGILTWKRNNLQVLHCHLKEVPVIDSGCMDGICKILAERLVPTAAAESNPNIKHIIGLCGPPGSGKSTLASKVVSYVNELWPHKSSYFRSQVESPQVAIVLPMDGFHLYRHQLDAMKDPEEAHARRGSPWTFDPERLLRCLTKLKNEGSVYVPSFDHGVGDPVEDDIFVNLQHKIVIVEGNYLLLDEGIWRDISCIFDEKWFIDVDIEKAMQRVLKRHLSIGMPPDVAKWQIDYNDRPNAELILESKLNADLIIKSVDFSRRSPTRLLEMDTTSLKGNPLTKLLAPKARVLDETH